MVMLLDGDDEALQKLMQETPKKLGQLVDYAVVMAAGRMFIGRVVAGPAIEPAYEAHVKFMADERGNFGLLRECTPILGSTAVRRLDIPGGAIVIACSKLTGRERQEWAGAIAQCEELIKAIRTAEAGLVLAPASPQLELVK